MSIGVHSKYGRTVSRDDLRRAEEGEKESLLDHDSDPDEETIFNQSKLASGEIHTDGKIANVRIQIKEVTDVMRENVKKVIERGERIEDLQEATDRLTATGNQFRQAATKAQRRAWMQNYKSRLAVIIVIATVVICILVLDLMVLYLVLR